MLGGIIWAAAGWEGRVALIRAWCPSRRAEQSVNRIDPSGQDDIEEYDTVTFSRVINGLTHSYYNHFQCSLLGEEAIIAAIIYSRSARTIGFRPIPILGIWTSRLGIPNHDLVCPTACSGSTTGTLTARAFKRRLPLNKAF